jgi:hypothetical protein
MIELSVKDDDEVEEVVGVSHRLGCPARVCLQAGFDTMDKHSRSGDRFRVNVKREQVWHS